jgi:hypothetical protein
MPKRKADQKQATTATAKEARARDAELAMREYQAERVAIIDKTARLRALRLAERSCNARLTFGPSRILSHARSGKTGATSYYTEQAGLFCFDHSLTRNVTHPLSVKPSSDEWNRSTRQFVPKGRPA